MMTKLLASSSCQHALLLFAALNCLSHRTEALQLESANTETGIPSYVCDSPGDIDPLVGSMKCSALLNELDCISSKGVYQGFCSWGNDRCFSGVDGEKTDCDSINKDLCILAAFSVARPCMWLPGVPNAPMSTRMPILLDGAPQLFAPPTAVSPTTNRPKTRAFGISDASPLSSEADKFEMDQYRSNTSGKQTSLRAEQQSFDLATYPTNDFAPATLHWNHDWSPDLDLFAPNEPTSLFEAKQQQLTTYPTEMEQTNEELLDTAANEEAKDAITPTLEPSFSNDHGMTSHLALMGVTSAAGNSSPFLGWVLVIVGFAFAELLFACFCYRSWRNEAEDSKAPAQLELTIICDDTDNTKARPMESALCLDDESMCNPDPMSPSNVRFTTP